MPKIRQRNAARALRSGALDRRLTEAEKPKNGVVTNRVVDAPDNTMLTTSPETGLPIEVEIDQATGLPRLVPTVVTASLRDDPLGRLRVRAHISDAEYAAGDWLRAQFDLLGRGTLRGVDTTRPQVDGGQIARDGITGAQQRAGKIIICARQVLGREGFALVRNILAERKFIEQVAAAYGDTSQAGLKYWGKRFRECLTTLAHTFGFVVRAPNARAPRDSFRDEADALANETLRRAIKLAGADLR